MKRNIITIDEAKCNGCGLCVNACHEGALQLVDGKAKLVSESYCDGLGACLPECPTGAITIEEREAQEFNETDAKLNMEKAQKKEQIPEKLACGCPGTHARTIMHKAEPCAAQAPVRATAVESELSQWPVQIRLVPVNAPYLEGAHLLIAADCAAYAYASFHQDFMHGKITLIGCPKLDEDYSEKFAAILSAHEIKSVTVVRMEVPCCGGIVNAVKSALVKSGKLIPWRVVIVGTDGTIIEDN